MSDAIDRAQAREQWLRAQAIERRARPAAEQPRLVGRRRHCIDCNDPISRERLRARPEAAVRCVECQAEKERFARRLG